MFKSFNINHTSLPKYLFFTGKGGVGKTSLSSAIALSLADSGKKVFLVSTDPASNLQDVFATKLNAQGVTINQVPNLVVANFDPLEAANQYKESIIAPYRDKLPQALIQNMEEQLSGSCTVEIAAFNQFAQCMANSQLTAHYDHIIFDTAPTGHTLRLLQLPYAWNTFIDENLQNASNLGQFSGLVANRHIYNDAIKMLVNREKTLITLVTRPEIPPLKEAERAANELANLYITNFMLLINGVIDSPNDELSNALYYKQQQAMNQIPEIFRKTPIFKIDYQPYNIVGIENLRGLLNPHAPKINQLTNNQLDSNQASTNFTHLDTLIDDLANSKQRVIFTMGKGGVGKTTIAAAIALGLKERGKKVHLTTTDPAAHLDFFIYEQEGISLSKINPETELANYKEKVLTEAKNNLTTEQIAYIEEDLKSPCTQEIAIFSAFASIVTHAQEEIVVIDTAPTGHTLLLLDASQSFYQEISQTVGAVPPEVEQLLPRLREPNYCNVVIVTLAEMTPVYEADRLVKDLDRAGIPHKWWVINSCLAVYDSQNPTLNSRANQEFTWIEKVNQLSKNHSAVVKWLPVEINQQTLSQLIQA